MNVIGYETGPIACRAAFTADFEMAAGLSLQQIITNLEVGRKIMDVRPGMRHKYTPLRFDPATGIRQIGGRYLFDTWKNVVDYLRFTSEELELEPGVTFWDRPFFIGVDKHAWHVIGAHDFTPMPTHYANRFERFAYANDASTEILQALWPSIRETAKIAHLSSVWLLHQPDECQIGLLTVVAQKPGSSAAERASESLLGLERMESLSRHFTQPVQARKIFDRTSLNLSLWLPWSRHAGGDPAAFPTFSVHPLPEPAMETNINA
ncbi:hypothetical protein ACQR1W_33810 [Bradyrhizobium sp. HKCCYLS1011]|uniref:hypothetical protein n=1 Tax=Bradyrhizobium sp. HKCCYLS1011 TaxID=3420733 RepID=UPI003EC005B0